MTDFPRTGRLIGIDYGTVRVGAAVTDPGQRMASPLENYRRSGKEADARWFQRLVAEERAAGIVVGLPLHNDGRESQKSVESRQFGKWLGELTGLPVCYFDERYTSAHAEELLLDAGFTSKQRKLRLDKLAAQIMLTAYLESNREEQPSRGLEDQ